MAPLTRRQLVQGSAAAVAAASLTSFSSVRLARHVKRSRPGSPGEELRIAVVGLNGRGNNHISAFQRLPNVDVVALCDVDSEVLARRKGELEKHKSEDEQWAGGKVDGYTDLRKLLEREDIHAISIATPNHLHALQTIWGCQAGKDVYVEKPVCHNIFEGRQMVRAAERYGRVVQTGTQSRSSTGIQQGIDWIHEGHLGDIRLAHGTCFKPRRSIGKVKAPTPIPEHVDYDLYCGPAPNEPLMRSRLHYDWHWQFATGNGDLGNQGIHQMDTCRWGLKQDALAHGVVAIGGRFGYDDDGDTPNSILIFLAYDPAPILFEVRGLPHDEQARAEGWGAGMDQNEGWSIGTTIYCENGHLVIPNSNDKSIAYDKQGVELQRWEGATSHFANFVEAVRARDNEMLHSDILQGHISSSLCHMGNDSYLVGKATRPDDVRSEIGEHGVGRASFDRLCEHMELNGIDPTVTMPRMGPFLAFDPESERFTTHREANALLTRSYREPFVVPQEV